MDSENGSIRNHRPAHSTSRWQCQQRSRHRVLRRPDFSGHGVTLERPRIVRQP
ncbi:hypothetical protein BC827DRAFT_1183982 [Russula dissimulans]|nr:hypothetical protein BC827DRAFT_1183982 [Russula dissimulans]